MERPSNKATFFAPRFTCVVDGRRRVFVNAFIGAGSDGIDWHPSWARHAVFVLDGGHSYWRIQCDLDSGEYVDFEQNGYA